MKDDKNVEALRAAYREWGRSRGENADCWLNILDDNVTLRSLGEGRPGVEFSRRRQSKIDVAAYLGSLTADWQMNYFKIDEYVAQSDRVVAIGSCGWRNKRTGKSIDTPIVGLWRFKNGKVIEYCEYYDTAGLQSAATP